MPSEAQGATSALKPVTFMAFPRSSHELGAASSPGKARLTVWWVFRGRRRGISGLPRFVVCLGGKRPLASCGDVAPEGAARVGASRGRARSGPLLPDV